NGAGTQVTHAFPTTGSFTPQMTATDKDGGVSPAASASTVTTVASIYALDTTASGSVTLSGNASITTTGQVIIASRSRPALTASGNPAVTAAAINVVGGYSGSGNATFSPRPTTGSAYVPDPLAALPAPTGGTAQASVNLSG